MKLESLLSGAGKSFTCELYTGAGVRITDEKEKRAALESEVRDITNDSRKVKEGGLFFAIKGASFDGHAYLGQVARAGVSVIVCEHAANLEEGMQVVQVVQVVVPSSRLAMALLSASFYRHPAKRLTMIGVTGTKGKTTTTYLVKSMLENAGIDTGIIGTIEMAYHDVHRPAANTTPESIALQKDLKEMADAGVKVVVMEVSSQALMLERTAGICYDIGVFTNLSEDHIGPNEHKDFADYLRCKRLLFMQCRYGIVNGDDPYVEQILEGNACEKVTRFGLSDFLDLYAGNLQLVDKPGELGVLFDTHGTLSSTFEVRTPGRFSVYNALAALSICEHLGVSVPDMQKALLQAKTRGRIELVKVSDDFTLMIDYAHNAVALESLLTTLLEYHPRRLVTLFGCGGNRARARRFEMGEVSGRLSDLTVITSDNPRFEEPMDIIADIVKGISKTNGTYITIPDRKEAIAYVIHNGEPGDLIVLAGKGHEDYQEIRGKKYPMDERVLIAEILEEDQKAGRTLD